MLRLLLSGMALFASGAGVSGGAVLLHRYVTRSPHFAISEIRAAPTTDVSSERILWRAGIELGENIFTTDLAEASERLRADPWIRDAVVRRELPSTITISVEQHEAACAVAFGPLYLADADGNVFKRATPREATRYPVITGLTRDGYLLDRDHVRGRIRGGLEALAVWTAAPRPKIGEIHLDIGSGTTLYTADDAVAIRLGSGNRATLRARVRRIDRVWQAIEQDEQRPEAIFAGQPTRPSRLTVRLARR